MSFLRSKAINEIAKGSEKVSNLSENQMEGLNFIVKNLENILSESYELSDNIIKLNDLTNKFEIRE